ncbi:hypothetical protein SDC9_87374 [bioreactor metagenome]|uniref:Uncharacterized protein n=1 Tax=bioreactor metagenome TaxID=1076179 RepID=A0A644ZIP6_9ZZZZ
MSPKITIRVLLAHACKLKGFESCENTCFTFNKLWSVEIKSQRARDFDSPDCIDDIHQPIKIHFNVIIDWDIQELLNRIDRHFRASESIGMVHFVIIVAIIIIEIAISHNFRIGITRDTQESSCLCVGIHSTDDDRVAPSSLRPLLFSGTGVNPQ